MLYNSLINQILSEILINPDYASVKNANHELQSSDVLETLHAAMHEHGFEAVYRKFKQDLLGLCNYFEEIQADSIEVVDVEHGTSITSELEREDAEITRDENKDEDCYTLHCTVSIGGTEKKYDIVLVINNLTDDTHVEVLTDSE